MREKMFAEAIAEAMMGEMSKDPNIFIAGEDVSWGGSFGMYLTVKNEYADRLIDTPITETAIAGLGLGSALVGLRPILEFNFNDFMLVAFDEIANQIAKFSYMNGGKVKLPIVLLAEYGITGGAAAQHSQSLESLFCHIPGLKVVIPSNPADAKGLMTAAIRDDSPVVFLQSLSTLAVRGDTPQGDYVVPLGKSAVAREGKDVTIISWGNVLHNSLKAAEMLAADGISAEVIDVRTLVPLDREGLLESVGKTHKVVIAHEAVKQGGFGAEIAAVIAEYGMDLLDAPITRLGAPFCPVPFSPPLEAEYKVSPEKIVAAVKSMF
jgi:pyruvate dehydrogenase E1 component beta subunit